MNAEFAAPAVRVRCPACRDDMGTVWLVRNYHHTEPVFVAGNIEQTKVVDIEDGLVVSTDWHRTGVREHNVAPHYREQAVVPDTQLLVWCRRDGCFELDHVEVAAWGAQARSKRTVITRAPRAAQRLNTLDSAARPGQGVP